MSLFPAYPGTSKEIKREPNGGNNWLKNNSFDIPYPPLSPSSSIKDEQTTKSKKKKKKFFPTNNRNIPVKKKKRKRTKAEKLQRKIEKQKKKELFKEMVERGEIKLHDYGFYIDNKGDYGLPKSLIPKYYKRKLGLVPVATPHKKSTFVRYFKKRDRLYGFGFGSMEHERRVTWKKEELSHRLADKPNDIKMWIMFVNFQDEFYISQHIQCKSIRERGRVAAQHKLDILNKAVSLNPQSRELQEMWLQIGNSILPSEEMSSKIESILENTGGTMTLWLGLVGTTQHSLARSTVPAVTQLFEKLLSNFQAKQSDQGRDQNVLELFFHYGKFLDQSGHWELLWTMIKFNLKFNARVELDIDFDVDGKVKELENKILEQEKQGIWQLWSQLERIREGLHFLPCADSVDYPQRCVSMDSIVNFSWHFHPDLHFQLIVTFILLLKVPILPTTETILKVLSPHSMPWVFDSPEYILAAVLTSPVVSLQFNYLSCLVQLTRGPQYLRKFHGQTEFFSLISHTFERCLNCLEGRKKTALGVWWLRFERWISLLKKLEFVVVPEDKKPAKAFFKEFLKAEENRDNLLYFVEYSLLELSLDNTEMCIKTLKKLISSRPPVLSLPNDEEKGILTSAYRTLFEVLSKTNQNKEALDLLIHLGSETPSDAPVTIHLLAAAEKKFQQVTFELIEKLDSKVSYSLEDFLLPSFTIEWISCHFWLIASTKSSVELKSFYTEVFNKIQGKESHMVDHIREALWETIITVTWTLDKRNIPYIKETLKSSFTSYPRNLKILTFMADLPLQNNEYWLTLKSTFLSTATPFSCVFLMCIILDHFTKEKEKYTFIAKNHLKHLACKEGKLSAMIQCQRLRFLYENDNSQLGKAQLQALEACPWNKSVYMESILLLPSKLMTLTDVLIEKELRIHITPDEIQEMRD